MVPDSVVGYPCISREKGEFCALRSPDRFLQPAAPMKEKVLMGLFFHGSFRIGLNAFLDILQNFLGLLRRRYTVD
jgi:hypothetical protein